MSKLDPEHTKIHIIGNNVTGNEKGEKLLKFLSKEMQPSKVKVESPLEFGQAGEWLFRLHSWVFSPNNPSYVWYDKFSYKINPRLDCFTHLLV